MAAARTAKKAVASKPKATATATRPSRKPASEAKKKALEEAAVEIAKDTDASAAPKQRGRPAAASHRVEKASSTKSKPVAAQAAKKKRGRPSLNRAKEVNGADVDMVTPHVDAGDDEPVAAPKRGRPRKSDAVDSTSKPVAKKVTPAPAKASRGQRAAAVKATEAIHEDLTPGRSRAAAAAQIEEMDSSPVKRGRARADTVKSASAPVKRGRPAKETKQIAAPAKRGRPAKTEIEGEPPKKRGRPAKKVAEDVDAPKRGRPAKKDGAVVKRGRPSKAGKESAAATTKAPAKKTAAKTTSNNTQAKATAESAKPATARRGRPPGSTNKAAAPPKKAAVATASTSKKRAREAEDDVDRPAKRAQKQAPKAHNTVPRTKLDVYVFGSGESGELGLGSTVRNGKKPRDVRRPRLNDLLDADKVGIVDIGIGGMHCVALSADGKIYSWGVNDNGALGRDTTWEAPTKELDDVNMEKDADSDSDSDSDDDDTGMNPLECTPTAMDEAAFGKKYPVISSVAATDSASFALTADGNVYGWGTFCFDDGIYGFDVAGAKQYASTKKVDYAVQRLPKIIPGLKNIVQIDGGGNHVLAIDTAGVVYAWGSPEQYQLGQEFTSEQKAEALIPHVVPLDGKMKSISAGSYHSFAISEDGAVYTWGLNNYGQTGIAESAGTDKAMVKAPRRIEALRNHKIATIVGGLQHSIACTESDDVLVWGRCQDGQIGVDLSTVPAENVILNEADKAVIVKVPTMIPNLKAVTVDAGIDNCLAVTRDGQAYAWGYSQGGRTGLGTDDEVEIATVIENTAVKGKRMTFAGCGGQYSILAGPSTNVDVATTNGLTNGAASHNEQDGRDAEAKTNDSGAGEMSDHQDTAITPQSDTPDLDMHDSLVEDSGLGGSPDLDDATGPGAADIVDVQTITTTVTDTQADEDGNVIMTEVITTDVVETIAEPGRDSSSQMDEDEDSSRLSALF